MVEITNFLDHPYTLKRASHITNFSIITPKQTRCIQSIDPAPVRHLLDKNLDDALQNVNSFLEALRSDISVQNYWFPLPQNPGNPSVYTPKQKRILTELLALEGFERLDPQANQKSRSQFLSNFVWTNSTLDQQTKAFIELLLNFNDSFASH